MKKSIFALLLIAVSAAADAKPVRASEDQVVVQAAEEAAAIAADIDHFDEPHSLGNLAAQIGPECDRPRRSKLVSESSEAPIYFVECTSGNFIISSNADRTETAILSCKGSKDFGIACWAK